jgi:hypothetical protein|tara:strand:- start:842 stop:1828 length:987 start_codon:yes stop_codon:yes gene_type:complete
MPKIPKDKLKCFTRTNKTGAKYVNCKDKTKLKSPAKKKPVTKIKLNKKAPMKAPAKKKPVTKIKLNKKAPAKKKPVTKINLIKKSQPVIKVTPPPPKPAPPPALAAPPKPPPANFNMLRPEIRRNILEFSGAVKSKEAQTLDKILLLQKNSSPRIALENTLKKEYGKTLAQFGINKILIRDMYEALRVNKNIDYKKLLSKILSRWQVYNFIYKKTRSSHHIERVYQSYLMREILQKNKNLFEDNKVPPRLDQKKYFADNDTYYDYDPERDFNNGTRGMPQVERDLMGIFEIVYQKTKTPQGFKKIMKQAADFDTMVKIVSKKDSSYDY